MQQETLVKLLANSMQSNWDGEALSDNGHLPLAFSAIAEEILANHQIFKAAGIQPGDKIALIGKNSVSWAVVLFSCLTYGATCVPILHEFHPDAMTDLIHHSDARLLFVDAQIARSIDPEKIPNLLAAINVDESTILMSRDEAISEAVANRDSLVRHAFPDGVNPHTFSKDFYNPQPDDVAVINYTSGSTGSPKGVMIPYRALWSNVRFALDNIPYLYPGDGLVSMLPLAHMFGMAFELLFPFCKGCHITFLGKVPSPRILLDAFAHVKPKLIITVPLVIEKIVRSKVLPALEKQPVKTLIKIPGLRGMVYSKVRRQMIAAFGGNLEQLIIGGAALSDSVNALLHRIKFPFMVGYGMTECAPLISYAPWYEEPSGSCGKVVDRMELRIDSENPDTTPGTLYVKGDNVMLGYYKNPEATAEVLDSDGWMNTGDVCRLDTNGYLYIKGRNKTMILGPSGQNIYPEEIETKLNVMPMVGESLIVDRDGKLVALIYPDYEAAEKAGIAKEKLPELMHLNINNLNHQIPAYSRISDLEIRTEPFEKTPKHSIRRFLYK